MAVRLEYRPEGVVGEDAYLAGIAERVEGVLNEVTREPCRELRLGRRETRELAVALAEFGEDLHFNAGMWRAYEEHNVRCFGEALPLTGASGQEGITAERVRHFLWVLYSQFVDVSLPPRDPGVAWMGASVARALREGFDSAPRESGVKRFLEKPMRYGWDVKQKLLWLGLGSYLFRFFYSAFMAENREHARKDPIMLTDDFLCEECTEWSGMGPTEVLAGALKLSGRDRQDLLKWNQRHLGPYRVGARGRDSIRVRNLFSNASYKVRMGEEKSSFPEGIVVFGALVPWREEWYWSGTQTVLRDATPEEIEDLYEDMMSRMPAVVYRLSAKQEARAREVARQQYEDVVARLGRPLGVFENGAEFKAGYEELMRAPYLALPEEERRRPQEEFGLGKEGPVAELPRELVSSKHRIAVFFDPVEEMEVLDEFEVLESGMRNEARPLPPHEAEFLRWIVEDPAMNPAFVRYMASRHGGESIKSVFALEGCQEEYWLEYLLRRYKGKFFRKRFPHVSVM